MKEVDFLKRVETSELAPHLAFFKNNMRPAIEMLHLQKKAGLGESRLGGMPDLPVGMSWPEHERFGPYCFIGQINFAQVPQVGGLLPQDGLLSLFFTLDVEGGEAFWQDPDYVLGIYTAAGTPLQTQKTPQVFDYFYPDKSMTLAFEAGIDVPFDCYQVKDWPFNDDESDAYCDIVEQLHPSGAYLLGYPSHCSLAYDPTPEGKDVCPLITLPSYDELEWCWHDGDKLMVFQEREKLLRGDFSNLMSDAG